MTRKIGRVVCGLLLVAAALMAQPPAEGRILTDAELSAIRGKIGDGCPCWDASNVLNCNQMDGCITCFERSGAEPEQNCPGNGKKWEEFTDYACNAEQTNPDTCNNGTIRNCYQNYSCKFIGGTILNNSRCHVVGNTKQCYSNVPPYVDPDLPDTTGWYCRKCERDESGTYGKVQPQTCI